MLRNGLRPATRLPFPKYDREGGRGEEGRERERKRESARAHMQGRNG